MCNTTGIEFGKSVLVRDAVAGKDVLEVGSLDVNGSLRPHVESLGPARYVGVDLEAGPRVDAIVDARRLVEHFGRDAFDVVVTTEMLEHVRNWQGVVRNLKQVLRPGGVLVLTTRSIGFHYHGYPFDFWRYEPEDMRAIFADFEDLVLKSDTNAPGIFVFARKPLDYHERTPSLALYSIVVGRRRKRITELDIALFRLNRGARANAPVLKKKARARVKRIVGPIRRTVVSPIWRRLPTPFRARVKRVLGRA